MNRTIKWTFFPLLCLLPAAALCSGGDGKNPRFKPQPHAGAVNISEREASGLLLDRVKPDYPPIAKVNYVQGRVDLQIVVGKDGKVEQAHLLQGFPILAAAALQGVKKWKYRPLLTNNVPTPFQTTARVSFYLRLQKLIPLPNWILNPVNIPMQPNRDFARQVRPPRVLSRPAGESAEPTVEIQVLLDENGKVLDTQLWRGTDADFERAQEIVSHWKFQPAYWGTLAIPWTLNVVVPVGKAQAR